METETDATVLGKLETTKHIHKVRGLLCEMISALDERARNHDLSKLESPEKEIFGQYTPELAKTEYGSKEYKDLLVLVKPAIEHHYSKNRHHPEHWPQGIEDMTLIDILEMLCDWKAAGERNKNGNIRKSLEVNTTRYNISPQLRKIMDNTVREHFTE